MANKAEQKAAAARNAELVEAAARTGGRAGIRVAVDIVRVRSGRWAAEQALADVLRHRT